jgi:pilus assembly protein CpaC
MLLSCTFQVFGQEKIAEKKISLVLGIEHVEKFDFAPHTKIDLGPNPLLTYSLIPQKREIVLRGLKPGTQSFDMRDTAGDRRIKFIVNVTATSQSKIVQELKEFLGDVEGLEIGIKGNSVYVGGKIVVPSDIGRVVVILDKYEDVLRLVELSPHTQRIIAKKMQQEIQNSGMRDVTVRVVNGLFWLEGIATSNGLKQRAQEIATAYIPDRIESLARRTDSVQKAQKPIIQNFITVNEKKKQKPVPKLIKITAQFVELSKDFNKVFGFKWTPLMSGDGGTIGFGKTSAGGVTTKSDGTLSGLISNLFPKLASAKSAGYARVIQSGFFITKDGIQGSINKKSTKKFVIGTGDFAKGEKTEAGFDLKVKPQIIEGEKIDLSIGLKVSAIVGDASATESNNISTNLFVKSKESAVVGGIVINKSATDFDRNPPGGTTTSDDGGTALFSFIKSKSYATSKSQFVVFITPEIIDSASIGSESIKRKFRQRRR